MIESVRLVRNPANDTAPKKGAAIVDRMSPPCIKKMSAAEASTRAHARFRNVSLSEEFAVIPAHKNAHDAQENPVITAAT